MSDDLLLDPRGGLQAPGERRRADRPRALRLGRQGRVPAAGARHPQPARRHQL